MEFGIGLVAGGVLGAFAVVKSEAAMSAAHEWLANLESSLKKKLAAKVAAFKSKL